MSTSAKPSSPRRGHVFVDESKKADYLLVAAVFLPGDVESARKSIRALHKPGQRRLHMVKESPARQGIILTTIAALGAEVTIYAAGAGYRTNIERRAACLKRLVEDAARAGHSRLILEPEEGEQERDRRLLFAQTRRLGCSDTLTYDHQTAATEPLLAVPDAIAWAMARGGESRRRATPLVAGTVRL